MRKTILGAVGGVALAAGLVATMVTTGVTSAAPAPARTATSANGSAAAGLLLADAAAMHSSSVQGAMTTSAAKRSAPSVKPLPVIRSVQILTLKSADVGDTVSGYVKVIDTQGTLAMPVPNAQVTLQQQRPGSRAFVTVGTGISDEGGTYAFSYTAHTNLVWRAIAQPEIGRRLTSKNVATYATAQVNWGARPDMDIPVKAHVSYVIRVSPAMGKAVLQWASARDRKPRWTTTKPVLVPLTGLATLRIGFGKPGTYLLRGSSVASATTAAGLTSTITITVS